MGLYQLSLTERHQHDCDTCVYKGSTFESSTQHYDWYVCSAGKMKPIVIKRASGEGSNYQSAVIFAESVGSEFIREALRLGILVLTVDTGH